MVRFVGGGEVYRSGAATCPASKRPLGQVL
jgi:hypothetical protein